MLFNSYEFIYVFFLLVLFLYWTFVRFGQFFAKTLLSIASVSFYCFMAFEYLPIMVGSILVNYFVGSRINKTLKRSWLIYGIIFNISNIVFFKYFDFIFIKTLGLSQNFQNTVIPLGISFYTFTQIAYLVDSYKKKIASDNSFVSYFLFVTYFPHLIAGPILHHKEMIEQFSDNMRYVINYENISAGLMFFVIGVSKKVLIADNLIEYVNPVFKAVSQGDVVTPLECWCAAIAYTFQLYFDFSGYSDMAVGLSRFFNFNLPFNFNSPYKSINMTDFWHRWHMSLSAFLKDYLYIPLGGNQKGSFRRYANLLITMLLGGLWHGANWTFFIWGLYHGILLSVSHLIRSHISDTIKTPIIIKRIITFLLVVLGWIIFRSESIETALKYYGNLLNFKDYLLIPYGW